MTGKQLCSSAYITTLGPPDDLVAVTQRTALGVEQVQTIPRESEPDAITTCFDVLARLAHRELR